MAQFSDQEILNGIINGKDERILAFLYDNVLPSIKKMVYKYNGNQEEAYDVFQEAILRFYTYVKQGKFNESNNVKGFIYTVSKNLYIDQIRKKNRSGIMIELNGNVMEEGISPLERIITDEKEAKVIELFSQLGKSCKELLVYFFFDNLSMKEISEKMGFSSENVAKTKKFKCKQRLIEIVKKDPSYKSVMQYE